MALTDAIGLPVVCGFPVPNLVLPVGAFWVVTARCSWPLAFPVFSGPIIWWIDKPHTEVLTFGMVSAAVVLLDSAPWWALIALNVVCYRVRAGSVLIPESTLLAVPNVDEFGVVLWDLNVGLIPAFPVLVPFAAAGFVQIARRVPAGRSVSWCSARVPRSC